MEVKFVLVLRAVAPDGAVREAAQLPVTSPAVYAARWDTPRGQVSSSESSGGAAPVMNAMRSIHPEFQSSWPADHVA